MSKKNSFSIFKHYFDKTNENKSIYGERTVVMMQVGSFYELYGLKSDDQLTGSNITEIADICEFSVSDKKLLYDNCPVFMAGCPLYTIDKFVELIIQQSYTVAVYVQNGDEKERILEGVYSSGTYITQNNTSESLSNNVMCIWFEVYKQPAKRRSVMKDTLIYGASTVDIMTGRSAIFQHETLAEYTTTNFDTLQRFVSVYNPSEAIIISEYDDNTINQIISYIGLTTPNIHTYDCRTETKSRNCMKQTYQQELISSYFGPDTYNVYDFRKDSISTQSFCFLLNFIQEHNKNLVKKISLPLINNVSTNVLLANHTLQQLNILDDNNGKRHGKNSSVMNLLNNCCTAIGKREFKYLITTPTTDENWLRKEYSIMEYMTTNDKLPIVANIRSHIHKIKDIEKIMRQILTRRAHPVSIYELYRGIEIIRNSKEYMNDDTDIAAYLLDDNSIDNPYKFIESVSERVQCFISDKLKIEECIKVQSSQGYSGIGFIQPGINTTYDDLSGKYNKCKADFYGIQQYLNDVMSTKEKKQGVYVKVHTTERSGIYLEITTKRSSALTNHLISHELEHKNGPIHMKDIKFVKGTASCNKIDSPTLKDLSSSMKNYEDAITKESIKTYSDFLEDLEKEVFDDIEIIVKYIMRMDLLQCKVYNADKYNYCCPVIEDAPKSFVNAKDMRHCLIEQIQQNETYVPNDVSIGMGSDNNEESLNGILLYGTNAVGKTSYIRALGICTILAQCGMFVPCSDFKYKPYKSVFSRIIGNDNLFRGLSTFAVEISELSVILNMADENSLILGDELCSGTEYQSAISIFISGLKHMNKMNSSFILATHFHDLVKYDEIKDLKCFAPKHMEVFYNPERDCLVYDRKLKDGEGNNNYGLEVCKSIHLRNDVLADAFSFRNKYFAETAGILSYNTSRYNQKKIKGMCEKCGIEIATEVHHILQQKDANDKGYIGSVHKNHKANLLNVCESCHHEEHHSSENKITRKMKTSTGEYIVL